MNTDRPTILLTGVTGQIGSYLAETLQTIGKVVAPRREALNLQSPVSVREAMRAAQPSIIVHAGAYTAVDRAESDREACFAVNAEATALMAELAAQTKSLLITFSTDYVFNGQSERPYQEGHETDPINVYGASKLAAEQALAASGADYLNLRTSWVYSARGNNFVKTMLRLGAERPELRVVDDQRGCPTSAYDAAVAVTQLLQQPREALATGRGNYHLAGRGETTWYEFAREVFRNAAEYKPDTQWAEVAAVPTSAFPTPARRPANSRLNCELLESRFGIALPEWKISTMEVVAELLRKPRV